jgi:FADH2-dependent halogenase
MFLMKHGITPVLIERMDFPRYHIGESMTGECGESVRKLGLEADMNRHEFPVKRNACIFGAKGYRWELPVASRDKDWKIFKRPTWQVRRADFDKLMLDTAIARGAEFIHGEVKDVIRGDDGSVHGLKGRDKDGTPFEIETEMVLDCSGQHTYLASIGVAGPKYTGNYDKQMAIFSQVAGAIRDEGERRDDTLLFYKKKYHWAWFIPLTDEIVSVGVVSPASYFKERKETKPEFLMRELTDLNPELARRVPDNRLIEGVRSIPNYSYQVRSFTGKGFICVGDAHRFIDPIFSFGVCLSLKEAEAAALATRDYLNGKGRDDPDPFAEYRLERERGTDVVEDMMDAFWEFPFPFATIVRSDTDEMTDIFAGRLWERQPSIALTKLRRLEARKELRAGGGNLDADRIALPPGARPHLGGRGTAPRHRRIGRPFGSLLISRRSPRRGTSPCAAVPLPRRRFPPASGSSPCRSGRN